MSPSYTIVRDKRVQPVPGSQQVPNKWGSPPLTLGDIAELREARGSRAQIGKGLMREVKPLQPGKWCLG